MIELAFNCGQGLAGVDALAGPVCFVLMIASGLRVNKSSHEKANREGFLSTRKRVLLKHPEPRPVIRHLCHSGRSKAGRTVCGYWPDRNYFHGLLLCGGWATRERFPPAVVSPKWGMLERNSRGFALASL